MSTALPSLTKPRLGALKGPARALRRRLVFVDRWATYGEAALQIVRQRPVLVFSMGKAGTTSLEVAVGNAGYAVLKAHSLTKAGIAVRFERAKRIEPRPRFLWRTQVIRWDLALRHRQRRVVVSAVRDPVARAISAYFYNLDSPICELDPSAIEPARHEAGVLRLLKGMALQDDWFTTEFKRVTGIDVYVTPFPSAGGYKIYENDNFRALVIRQEDLPQRGPEALASLLGHPEPLEISRRNRSTGSVWGTAYEAFRRDYAFDLSLLEAVYSQRAFTHFYSDGERSDLILKWSEPGRRETA